MLIDCAYVINLKTPHDVLYEKLKQIKLEPPGFKIYSHPAINGWELENNSDVTPPFEYKKADWWNTNEYGDNRFYNREVTPGEAGCMLSHYQVILNAYKQGFQNILILEEDFVPLNKFPSQEILDEVPSDCSILYLDRNALWDSDKETRISKNVTKVGYSYNNHAYIVTRKGMNEVINSSILDNIIISDEFFPAINGTSDRLDAVEKFHDPKFKAYSLNGGYFNQSSNIDIDSTTESTPKKQPIIEAPKMKEILDCNNWEEWSKKYIHPLVLSKEYDLIADEPIPHVYNFPFFTKKFCKEIIELSETVKWTNDRHEFYPTTDNLLSALGMEEIYTRVINEYLRPIAIHFYQLEGHAWDVLNDESFIIRYKPEEQAHLGIHHDYGSVTTLVNLNPGEFKGGGTYFPKFKHLVNPQEIGVMSLHPSNITHKHGARPVTEGTRYVIVSFCKNKNLA
jgi:GR25 family glycosyltransferase involved in LPS biosynthesis